MDAEVFCHQNRRGLLAASTYVILLLSLIVAPSVLLAGAAAVPDSNNPPSPAAVVAADDTVPAIELTYVPSYGAAELLRGRVSGVDPNSHVVAVYIEIPPYGWWSKPTREARLTAIRADGTWDCNIVTTETDAYATRVAAFLVPASFDAPLLDGQACLPPSLYAYPYAQVVRYERIVFANCDWLVRREHDPVDPGPNYFSDDIGNVWLDESRRLHLKVAQRDGTWYCSEVIADRAVGHGRYSFTVAGGIDRLNPNAVLGLFTWEDCLLGQFYREIDIELSRQGDPNAPNTQYVVQPAQHTGNTERFETNSAGDPNGVTTHEFIWEPNEVSFRSYYGGFVLNPAESSIFKTWRYTGPDVPKTGNGNIHANLWLLDQLPPTDGNDVEIRLDAVHYLPYEPNEVYRFWSPVNARHFYTISRSEKEKVEREWSAVWTYEGVAYLTCAQGDRAGLVPVYRFWSNKLSAHFFTALEWEKDKVISDYPDVWAFEGIAFYAWLDGQQPPGTSPVYRFWSDKLGSHFYTINGAEKDQVVKDYPDVWTFEGIAWHAYALPAAAQ